MPITRVRAAVARGGQQSPRSLPPVIRPEQADWAARRWSRAGTEIEEERLLQLEGFRMGRGDARTSAANGGLTVRLMSDPGAACRPDPAPDAVAIHDRIRAPDREWGEVIWLDDYRDQGLNGPGAA